MRGLGGKVKAMALPFERLSGLPGTRAPWNKGGPLSARNAVVAGSWYLPREVELSCARAAMVTLQVAGGKPTARWHLPASKTDPRAEGVARTHECSCGGPVLSPSCPVHALMDHLGFLKRAFPEWWTGDDPDWDLPLFPTSGGLVCDKDAVAETLVQAARLLGVP